MPIKISYLLSPVGRDFFLQTINIDHAMCYIANMKYNKNGFDFFINPFNYITRPKLKKDATFKSVLELPLLLLFHEDAKNRVHHGIHGRPHMAASGLLLGHFCKL